MPGKHALRSTSFLDPFLLNKIRRENLLPGIVTHQYTIEVEGQHLCLVHPEEISLAPGQHVFVMWSGSFFLETEDERRESEQEQAKQLRVWEEQHAREKEARRVFLNQQCRDAETFNASLCIPAQWKPGYKSVLSGLSASSNGDGRNRSTVEHIWLQADLDDGRLHRKRGDFLCSSSEADNGQQWVSPLSTAQDGDGNYYPAKVTCQACLKIAQRWIKPRGAEQRE